MVAFITRNNIEQIFVHEHVNFPEAGVKVPAGTVEENEYLIDELFREIYEETGLEDI